ncbi:hypothetical protein VPH35_073343 [Triticum aestivum]
MDGIHVRGTCWSKGSASRSYFIAENHKDVVGCVFHERGAPGYDLAMNMTAYQVSSELCFGWLIACKIFIFFYPLPSVCVVYIVGHHPERKRWIKTCGFMALSS